MLIKTDGAFTKYKHKLLDEERKSYWNGDKFVCVVFNKNIYYTKTMF